MHGQLVPILEGFVQLFLDCSPDTQELLAILNHPALKEHRWSVSSVNHFQKKATYFLLACPQSSILALEKALIQSGIEVEHTPATFSATARAYNQQLQKEGYSRELERDFKTLLPGYQETAEETAIIEEAFQLLLDHQGCSLALELYLF